MIRGWRLMWGKPEMPVYFNQFYANSVSEAPTIGKAADMRMGTWLARDIPLTGMGIYNVRSCSSVACYRRWRPQWYIFGRCEN
jgi:hypothetical protein